MGSTLYRKAGSLVWIRPFRIVNTSLQQYKSPGVGTKGRKIRARYFDSGSLGLSPYYFVSFRLELFSVSITDILELVSGDIRDRRFMVGVP